jgi:hypothetical protein
MIKNSRPAFSKTEIKYHTYLMAKSSMPEPPQPSSTSSVLANPAQPSEIQLRVPGILREEIITFAIALRMNDTR